MGGQAGLDVERGWKQRGALWGSFSAFLLLSPPPGVGKNQKKVNQEMLEVSSEGRAADLLRGWMWPAKKSQVWGFLSFPQRKLDLSFEK